MTTGRLFEPLHLPSGERLQNRVIKAAMEEHLGDPEMRPGRRLHTLYRKWGDGGVGAILTGNVMIDGRAATSPSGVALEAGSPLKPFALWAYAAKAGGAAAWMQLNHPGRQVKADQCGIALSPSGIGLDSSGYASPRAMDADDILDVTRRFATSAALAIEAGFTGIQIHAAHGYLLNQFLSPLANRRTDAYGGSVQKRARLLLEVLDAVHAAVPAGTTVAVKLNSADFQRGGFDTDDAVAVVHMLNERGVDLLELSGGNASKPAMYGARVSASTRDREAYFLALSQSLVEAATMPTMLTGGIRSVAVAEEVLATGIDAVGIGTALAVTPDLPRKWLVEPSFEPHIPRLEGMAPAAVAAASQSVVRWLLRRWASSPDRVPAIPDPAKAVSVDVARRMRLLPGYHAYVHAAEINAPKLHLCD